MQEEITEVEVIGNPFDDHGKDMVHVEIGQMFHDRDPLEECDDHDCDDYDHDYEEDIETVKNSYFGDYFAGKFYAKLKKNKLDDLGELLIHSEKYKEAMQKTSQEGNLFQDPEFEPDTNSLVGYCMDPKKIEDMSNYSFKRSTEYFGEEVKVFDTMSPGDIIQGYLGDCYFLAAISSIAEHPQRLQRIILTKENNPNAVYAVALCLNGVWEEVVLDDFAPCTSTGNLAFNRSKSNELWVVLLEKAWAKVHGGYLNIEAGLTREALRDLTGASAKTFFLSRKPEEVWKTLLEADQNKFILTAGSDNLNSGSDAYIQKVGICGSHAYSLLSVFQLTKREGSYSLTAPGEDFTDRVVKLRNPWGKGEWKGDWADSDPRWTPELKELLGFTGNLEDGIFFMNWEDFQKFYSDVQVCYFHDGFKYSAEKFKTKRNENIFLKFQLDKPGKYYFSVNQRNRRFFPKSEGYRYSKIGWVVGQKLESEIKFIGSGNKPDKENWDMSECEAGEYYAAITTPWRSVTREFSFSVYGPGLTDFEKIDKSQLPENFITDIFKSQARMRLPTDAVDFGSRKHPGIMYVSGEKNGWAYMYFQNDESDHAIKVTLKLGESSMGVKVLPPHEEQGNKPTMLVGPGENDIIIYKSNGPKGVSVSLMTSFRKVEKKDPVQPENEDKPAEDVKAPEPTEPPAEPAEPPAPTEPPAEPTEPPAKPIEEDKPKIPEKIVNPAENKEPVTPKKIIYRPGGNTIPSEKPQQPSGGKGVIKPFNSNISYHGSRNVNYNPGQPSHWANGTNRIQQVRYPYQPGGLITKSQ